MNRWTRLRTSLLTVALALAGSCSSGDEGGEGAAPDTTAAPPAIEDGATRGTIVPTAETEPAAGDADDPAVWVHPTDPAASLVIGTDKQEGLAVYDLAGRRLQFVSRGTPNNVDLRDGIPLGGKAVSLVVAADDSGGGWLQVYKVDPAARRLVDVAARRLRTGIEAHGICLYRSARSGKLYAFPNDQDGRTEQWELFDDGSGRIDGRPVRSFDREGAVEGCVADDAAGALFVGEEEAGVWRYDAEPDAPPEPVRVDRTGEDGHLTADVEGLAILDLGGGDGYLIASSQGDHSFVIYRRTGDHDYAGRFRVGAAARVDGCEDTDGIEVVNRPLGAAFPAGLFVCQDGENGAEESNFKLVPLDLIIHTVLR